MKIEIFSFHFSFSVERQTFSLAKENPFEEATAKSLTNSQEREKKKDEQYYIILAVMKISRKKRSSKFITNKDKPIPGNVKIVNFSLAVFA